MATTKKTTKPAEKATTAKAPAKKAPVKAAVAEKPKPAPKVAKEKEMKTAPAKAEVKKTAKPEPKATAKAPVAKKAAPKAESVKKATPAKKAAPVAVEAPAAKEAKAPARKKAEAAKPAEIKKVSPKKEAPVKNVKIPKLDTNESVPYKPDFTHSVLDTPGRAPEAMAPILRYSDKDLQEFKQLIHGKLESARKELNYLQGLITRKDNMGGDNDDARYMTMEDGSLSMEREQLSQMASRQISFIDHLEKALIRIENKTYGICRVTGQLIDKARLKAVPHATLSVEAKNSRSGANV